jgi:F-type H+-transporting ATPase subunit a
MANEHISTSTAEQHLTQQTAGAQDTTAQANPHNASEHGATGTADNPSAVFMELLSGLGDHHSLTIFNVEICELPVAVYDKTEGFHFYKSMEAMNEAKVFTMNAHHKIAPVSNPETPVTLDMSITNLLVFQWAAILLVLAVFGWAGRKYRKAPEKAPTGLQSLTEMAYTFVKDDVVVPNMVSEKIATPLMPYFLSLFLFIFSMNILGLVPGGHTATGAIGTTCALALTALCVINIKAIYEIGFVNYFMHLTGGAPWFLWFVIVPIEIISIFVKPFALTIRLFANMSAGHIILFSFMGLIFFFARSGMNPLVTGTGIGAVSVAFSVFILFLESLVSFLQAYIFTLLTAVFTGISIGNHAEEH